MVAVLPVLVLCALCGYLSTTTVQAGSPPLMIMYNKRPPEVSTYTVSTMVESDNQLCLPYEIKATRVCVMSGTWILYPESSFRSSTGELGVYSRIPADLDGTCRLLPSSLDRAVGSYRFAGDPLHVDAPYLNLYVLTYYRETQLTTNTSMPEVRFAFNSLIKSGPGRWEFFMSLDFSGFSGCLDENEVYVPDFTARFGVEAGDIKSIREGCSRAASKLNPRHVLKGHY